MQIASFALQGSQMLCEMNVIGRSTGSKSAADVIKKESSVEEHGYVEFVS